jgi:hypothetical protein
MAVIAISSAMSFHDVFFNQFVPVFDHRWIATLDGRFHQ